MQSHVFRRRRNVATGYVVPCVGVRESSGWPPGTFQNEADGLKLGGHRRRLGWSLVQDTRRDPAQDSRDFATRRCLLTSL